MEEEAQAQAGLDDLRAELRALQADEARLSAERRRLHDRIDFGFASETTRGREREISDERRRVQERLDCVRELLRAQQRD